MSDSIPATDNAPVFCPECPGEVKMHRMGTAWSGRHKIQRYRCPKCGRTTTAPAKAPVDKTAPQDAK